MIAFKNRSDAGKQLAQKLLTYRNGAGTLVFGLARGGVVVAYEIAKELSLPLREKSNNLRLKLLCLQKKKAGFKISTLP